MTEAIISGALLRILQTFIGLAQRLELRLRIGAAAIAVRMAFHGELAIGRLDRRRIGRALDLEQLVIIGFNHGSEIPLAPSPSSWT